jgi:hypothetical protein
MSVAATLPVITFAGYRRDRPRGGIPHPRRRAQFGEDVTAAGDLGITYLNGNLPEGIVSQTLSAEGLLRWCCRNHTLGLAPHGNWTGVPLISLPVEPLPEVFWLRRRPSVACPQSAHHLHTNRYRHQLQSQGLG